MRSWKAILAFICVLGLLNATSNPAFSRGIGGGGLRGGGGGLGGGGRSFGGGGISRPSSPSVSRPSVSRPVPSRPSVNRPSTPSTRPSGGGNGSLNRSQIGGGNRPSIQPANRPSVQPGNRPSITPGTRPGSTPVNRPSNGTRPNFPSNSPGSRPSSGSSNRLKPGNGLSGIDTGRPITTRPSQLPSKPNVGDRPTTLPGLGNFERPGNQRPGLGDRPGARPGLENRPSTRPSFQDRQDSLQDRLNNRENNISDRIDNRGDRIDNRGDRIDNRQDRWNDRQDRWNDWYDHHYSHHGHWHNGHWHCGWYPGTRWNYWWDNYPVLTAFGVTTWAVNRVGWAFGYYDYHNPYAGGTYIDNSVYNYSQPIVMTPQETTLSGDPTATAQELDVSEEGLSSFDQARVDFYEGQYDKALVSTDAALKEIPNDSVIHEFRALCNFALGKYSDAAGSLYAILSVGPGWDWTTMSGLYSSVDVYTEQIQKLEEFCKTNPDDPASHFVLAYHYLTQGHDDAAMAQYKGLVEINPQDLVSRQILFQLDPDAKIPNGPAPVEPPKPTVPASQNALLGNWSADRGSSKFEMSLADDSTFKWAYREGDSVQEVTGIWGVDEEGVLALEMKDDGVLLAQTISKGDDLDFYMLGDNQGKEPLHFHKIQ